jgi:RNA-directed DNA polymerase
MLFTEDTWDRWTTQEQTNYKLVKNKSGTSSRKYLKKGYTHFDLPIWFPKHKDEIKQILENNLRAFHKAHGRLENYAFSPFIKLLIKTPRYRYQASEGIFALETKIRPICYAAHRDSLIFGFYAFALNEKYQDYIKKQKFDECVLAYRTDLDGKCNIQFAKEVFDEVRRRSRCTAIALDIKGYFDHIDHQLLRSKWEKILGVPLPKDQTRLYRALTEYSYTSKNSILKKYGITLSKLPKPPKTLLDLVPGSKDYLKFQRLRDDKLIVTNNKLDKRSKTMIGIPQGTAMSALLSNIYLCDYDHYMNARAKEEGFMYRRYCDDILIICDGKNAETLQKVAIKKITDDCLQEIQPRKVELTLFEPNSRGNIRAFNKKKMNEKAIAHTDGTNERYFYKSLQYLGFEFNGQDIFIRSSSLSRYFMRLKARIVKTVSMAYSDSSTSDKIFKEQLFHRYSHLGKRNFLKYAYNASKKSYQNSGGVSKEGMNSMAIRRQVSRHFDHLIRGLKIKNEQRFTWKGSKASVLKQV